MAFLLMDDYLGRIESAPRGTLVAGNLVNTAGVIVGGVTQPVKGLVYQKVPTDNAPNQLKLIANGCFYEDTVFDGVAVGNLVWSVGDGSYTVSEPAGAAGTMKVLWGVVRRIDTRAADTGCYIYVLNQIVQDGAA